MARSFTLFALIFLLAGCAVPPNPTGASSSPSADASAIPPTAEPTSVAPAPATTAPNPVVAAPTTIPPQASALVEQVRQAAAKQTGVALTTVTVTSVTAVSWPTSALGCPQPGTMYSQLVTPGYKIVVSVNGKNLEYHSDRGTRVVACPTP